MLQNAKSKIENCSVFYKEGLSFDIHSGKKNNSEDLFYYLLGVCVHLSTGAYGGQKRTPWS